MDNTASQNQDEDKVKEAAEAFDSFMSTMNELTLAQQTAINKARQQIESEKIETLKKQISEK